MPAQARNGEKTDTVTWRGERRRRGVWLVWAKVTSGGRALEGERGFWFVTLGRRQGLWITRGAERRALFFRVLAVIYLFLLFYLSLRASKDNRYRVGRVRPAVFQ